MTKPPKLEYVKYVHAKGKWYAYFNTGKTNAWGNPIRVSLPAPGSVGFFDAYATMKGAREKRQAVAYTIANLADDYLDSLDYTGKAEGTQRYYSTTLRKIVKLLGKFPVNDLRREDLMLVLDHEMSGPGAYNAFTAVLGVVYTFARRRGKTTLKPVEDVPKQETGQHEAWPEHVVEAGLKCEHDRTRLAVHLLYFTGQRIGDVMKMRWTDVAGEWVHVVQQKTGKKLKIKLHAELQAELARTPRRGDTIIVSDEGRQMTPQVVRRELKALCQGMGYTLVPHGLRKNAVIALLEAGCTVAEAAAITGQTFKVVEQYAAQVDQGRLSTAAVLKWENKRGTGKPIGKPARKPAEKRAIK